MVWPRRTVGSLHRRLAELWGVGFLLARIFLEVGPRRIPPVTAVVTMLQVGFYCRLVPLQWRSPLEVCMSVNAVLRRKQWRRVILSQLEHADSMHLYFNMTSFVWKGIRLEKEMGMAKFTRVLLLFLVEVGVVSLLLTAVFGSLLYGELSADVCSIGFSGVVFALKVLKNVEWNQDRVLPAWLVWFELLFIHVVAPQSSLLGHLAGVLVGSAYVYGCSVSSSRLVPTCGATLVSGIIVALQFPALPSSWKTALQAPCLSADLVLNRGYWKLLLLSPLYASSDLHTAYVACSLMFIGSRYERQLGSAMFAIRLLTLTLVTGLVYCLGTHILLSSVLGVSKLDGVHVKEARYKCFTGCTAILLALKLSFVHGAQSTGSSGRDPVMRCLGLQMGQYPFLWLELPCPPLLGAVLETAFLRVAMPFLWIPGNAAGIVVGLVTCLFCHIKMRAGPGREHSPNTVSTPFLGI